MSWWALKKKIHISWLIAILGIGIFIGVFLSKYIRNTTIPLIVCLFVSIALIILVFWKKIIILIPVLLIGGIIFGFWRGSISQNELDLFKPYYGKVISIKGIVKDDVDTDASNQSVIRLDEIVTNNSHIAGILWITTASEADIKRGDELLLRGNLREGFGNFAGVIYRADIDKITHPIPGDVARVVRDWFADGIRRAISDPEASLGIGFLVGQRRALPADLVLALQMVGLTHVVVASGYNLTILVRLARRALIKVSKYLSTLSAFIMIFSFIAITGLSPSMARAGLVASLSLLAWYYGRQFHPLVLLSFAIAVTVLINPSYAWGDLGWQLSFAAFAGVMIVAPLAQRYFFGDKKPGVVAQILGETVSAQIVTAPIIIMAFNQLSNVSIVSNLLILPFVPLAMLLVFIAGVGSITLPGLSWLICLPASWLLKYMIKVIEYLASLPWAVTSNVHLQTWWVVAYYFVIIGVCLYMWRKTKYNLREVNLVE